MTRLSDYRWLQARDYVQNVELMIQKDIESIPLDPEKRKQLLDHPELELELDYSYEELLDRLETFPQVLRRSVVVTIWSLLEVSTDELARTAGSLTGARFVLTDLRGSGLVRAVTYLSKTLTADPRQHPAWSYLSQLQDVRNVLVHRNGSFPRTADWRSFREFIQGHAALSLRESYTPDEDVVVLKQGFAEQVLHHSSDFYHGTRALLEQLRAHA